MGLVSNSLFGVRTLVYLGAALPDHNYLLIQGAVTVVEDEANDRNVLTVGGTDLPATFGALSASSLTLGADSQYTATVAAPLTTSDAGSPHNLAVVQVPTGTVVTIRFGITAKLVSDAGVIFGAAHAAAVLGYYNPAGTAVQTADNGDTVANWIGTPFSFGGYAAFTVAISGSSVQIQGTGYTVPAYVTGSPRAYAAGAIVASNGACYCTKLGGTTAPQGGGLTGATPATDGSVTDWLRVSATSTINTIWTVTRLEVETG